MKSDTMRSISTIVQHGSKDFEIFTVDDVFTELELSRFDGVFEQTESVSPFTRSAFRNGKAYNTELSTIVWEKLKHLLPCQYESLSGRTRQFTGCAPFIMFAEMIPGQLFGIHTDTGCVFERKGMRESSHTVLIYLTNDVTGGATQFFDASWKSTCSIQPKRNRTLCFDIDLYHRGTGSSGYTLSASILQSFIRTCPMNS